MCQENLLGFVLSIYKGDEEVYNSSNEAPLVSATVERVYIFDIDNVIGDRVMIQLLGGDVFLSLAEVEVYAMDNTV